MKKFQTLCLFFCLFFVVAVASARDLKEGMEGEDVRQWQIFLQRRNFDLPADGLFGPVTKRATLIFQKKWKLYRDGVVGKQTLRKARSLGFNSFTTKSKVAQGTRRRATPQEDKLVYNSVYNFLYDTYRKTNWHRSFSIEEWGGAVVVDQPKYKYQAIAKYRARNDRGVWLEWRKLFKVTASGEIEDLIFVE